MERAKTNVSALADYVVEQYEMDSSDRQALEAELFEQLRLSYLQQLRTLAEQHGNPNPTPIAQGEQLERLQAKAREDAQSIVETHNRELRNQVTAILTREPNITQARMIGILEGWGRERDEHKAMTIALHTIMWAASYGLTMFITRNNLQHIPFTAIGGIPVCPICIEIVARGIVSYAFVELNPLPAHVNCTHEYIPVNPTNIMESLSMWVG